MAKIIRVAASTAAERAGLDAGGVSRCVALALDRASGGSMIRGSCLCGGIRYAVDEAAFGEVVHCHCSMCRKATGAAFRTRAAVRASGFRWLAGEALLSRHESSPGEERTFCRVCGSTLVTFFRDRPGELGLPLGTLDDDPGVRPSAHVWVA